MHTETTPLEDMDRAYARLLWVVANGEDPVGTPLDPEVEAVVIIYTRLPDITSRVVLPSWPEAKGASY